MTCSVCAAPATVELRTDDGTVRICGGCARLLEALGKLMGLNTRRRTVLQVVE